MLQELVVDARKKPMKGYQAYTSSQCHFFLCPRIKLRNVDYVMKRCANRIAQIGR